MNHFLLNKFFANECSSSERKVVIDWMLNAQNDFLLKEWMKDNWDKLSDFDTENDLDIDKMWTKLQASLQFEVDSQLPGFENTTSTFKGEFSKYRKIYKSVAAAAAILIIFSLTIIWVQKRNASRGLTAYNKPSTTITNNENVAKLIVLEDGTKVSLSKNASLTYNTISTMDRREVNLEGDAFFDVVKNPEKPFLVYSKNIITKVLGTSFSIHSNINSNDVTVSVVTGKVQVFEKNEENLELINSKVLSNKGILLTPNQKTIYTASKQNFETSIVETPVLLNNITLEKNYFDFNRSYLPDVVNKLQKVYGIEVVLENDNFNKCIFSGDITEENLYEKLDLICKSIGATYEISGTRILITGKGCK